MPVPAIPSLSPPGVSPPSIGAPPAAAGLISQLIHSGAGPEALFAAAQQMRQHAAELSATASQLRQSANNLGQEWDSAAGREAASRVDELGTWYDGHAQHATAAAAALEHQGDNFGRARAAIATPRSSTMYSAACRWPSRPTSPGQFRPLRPSHRPAAAADGRAQHRNLGPLRRILGRCADQRWSATRCRPRRVRAAMSRRSGSTCRWHTATTSPRTAGPPLPARRHQDHSGARGHPGPGQHHADGPGPTPIPDRACRSPRHHRRPNTRWTSAISPPRGPTNTARAITS